MNLLKIEKSQNFELQNSLKTKMEEQGEKDNSSTTAKSIFDGGSP